MFTKEDIINQLAAMGAPRGGVILMHTALRLVGEVEGGASGLLDALIEYFTAEGGLFCIPTRTGRNFGKEISLDMTVSESHLGTLPIIATEDGRGIRTENPTHSMVTFGDRKKAIEFAKDELNLDTPTSPESCYGKLLKWGGHVLLVGVGQNKNTFIHTVEEILEVPDRITEEKYRFAVRRESGEVVDRYMRWFDESKYGDVSLRFSKFEMPLRYFGAITDGFIGNAPTQLLSAEKILDVLTPIYKNPDGRDPLSDEKLVPPRWYARKDKI